MSYKNYITYIFLVLIFSCSSNDDNDDSKDSFSYEYVENSKLEISSYQDSYLKYSSVEEGNKTVFLYTFVAEQNDDIADDEYAEYIRFEVDSNTNNFVLENNDLVASNIVLNKICYCFFGYVEEKDVVPTGLIEGEKISNNSWRIKLNVEFYGEESRSFNKIFRLKN